MVFGFDGEYSVVADPSRGLGDVRNRVEDVKQQIASVGGWNFSRLGSFLVNGGAVVTRFSCLHEIVLQHPISPASSSETSGPVANTNPEELKGNEPAPPESSSDVNGTKTVSPQQVDGQPPCDPQMNVDLPPKASKSDGPPLPQTLEGSVPTAPGVPEPLLGGILVKRMTGELEVGVVADITHRFFPGQRIVVRFRLVG
ncbi:hypothetical protein JAAARDRAFT_260483 [Jaapia argillacea MUCL 33604]|uniref:Uncharacterized protein n=1 Tax=Jaapia argillacea MUCL 33604 TaxID=933084 RepID=A0A067Q6G8_9AGAM|nr:hypothetical protein JAAARDRAFT_260483 [Jaapia argillacea MUCL 33604]